VQEDVELVATSYSPLEGKRLIEEHIRPRLQLLLKRFQLQKGRHLLTRAIYFALSSVLINQV